MGVLMYPPCLSYPLRASGSMYPRDLYPLLDWREGGNLRKYVQQSAAAARTYPDPPARVTI